MTPCDNCIEIECEVNGYICPLYKKYQDDTLEKPQGELVKRYKVSYLHQDSITKSDTQICE